MYADDMVIFSESAEGLQNMLHSLSEYATEWGLTVNIDKTKILVFYNGGNVNNVWLYDNNVLDVVDQFNYLGLLLNYNGKFNITQNKLAEQGRKALYSLRQKAKNLYLNYDTMLSLFDTYVSSVLLYACEIWSANKATAIEKVHLDFCKRLLGVKVTTMKSAVYFEWGRYPLYVTRKIRVFKYWIKLLNTNNCILQNTYSFLLHLSNVAPSFKNNWVLFIKDELCKLGLHDIWLMQSNLDCKNTYFLIKQRIFDIAKQEIMSQIQCSSKCNVYKYLIDNFCIQTYLSKPIPSQYKKYLSKFRLSSHQLAIEVGRFKKVEKCNRFCFKCRNTIEDEFHFILQCPLYSYYRTKYIKSYYWKKPSTYKLLQLLSVQNVKELCNLGKFLKTSYLYRSKLVQ